MKKLKPNDIPHFCCCRCIAKASGGSDGHYVVTSSENGEMFLWDTTDGRCVESRRANPSLVHTHIQSYRSGGQTTNNATTSSHQSSEVVKLFCCGFYEEICVMDPLSLKVMFSLASRINPDWIAAFHVLR